MKVPCVAVALIAALGFSFANVPSLANQPALQAAGQAIAWRGAASCRFVAPASLGGGQIEWVGSCRAKRANGLGMLRPRGAGAVDAAFYGRVVAGSPALGIVETPEGFRAGRFISGDIETGDDIGARNKAFEAAAQAARAVSQSYRARGNQASARYYRDKAAFLELQVE